MRLRPFVLLTFLAACSSSANDNNADSGQLPSEASDASSPDATYADAGVTSDAGSDGAVQGDSGTSQDGSLPPAACKPLPGPTPAATVNVDAAVVLRTIPDDLFGFNGQVWDAAQHGTNAQYNAMIKNAGFKVMRWPGGSWGDKVAWNNINCFATYAATYDQSHALYQQLGIRFQPIVNASSDFSWCTQPQMPQSHTEQEAIDLATAWVADGALGAKYWEVGNEIYGNWEQGGTTGAVYGNYFADYYKAMKKANPAIKVLAVGRSDAGTCGGCVSGTATWTEDVLRAAFAKGVVPDGFQIHHYFDPVDTDADLLHSALDSIAQATTFLNTTVAAVTGKHQQLDYAMTEFATRVQPAGSGIDRVPLWISGQFVLQFILEMAQNNWAASNTWGNVWDSATYKGYPSFYMYAFLNGKFGRQMVGSKSSSPDIRSYASVDTNGDMTLFVANNATAATTVRVSLSNYGVSCMGEKWLMEGANGGGGEATDIAINGVVHPAEATAQTMAGVSFPTGGAFNLALPASSVALLKLPRAH